MGKYGAILFLSALSLFVLWTVSNVCDYTTFCGGLTTEIQRAKPPQITAPNETQQETGLANISARLNENAEEISDENGEVPAITHNKMETTQSIENEENNNVGNEQKFDVTNAGSIMRNGWRKNYIENEPKPGEKHIIFLETRCLLDESHNYTGLVLHKRQVCAIESAAKMNPDHKVYLLYTCPVYGRLEYSSEYVQTIFTYPNVNLWKLEIKRHFSKTPLENWNFKDAIMSSLWPLEHGSDVLRFLSLWKYGGTYLDMDFVILKSLDALGTNYVGLETPDNVGSSVLNFAWDGLGHEVADRCVEELRTNFRGDIWAHNGPGLIGRVLQEMCNCSSINQLSTERCGGFQILSSSPFFPIPYSARQLLFSESSSQKVMGDIKDSFGVHLWNKRSKNMTVNAGSRQPYSLMAARACPGMYGVCGGYF